MSINRNACRRGLFAVSLYMLIMATGTSADVVSGRAEMTCAGWDFSEQTCKDVLEMPDIFLAFVVDPPLGLRVSVTNPASIVMLPDSVFEDLRFAPEDSSLYYWDWPALLNVTYVARTREGTYAKFRFLQLPYLTPIIEYVYQPDGSRRFFNVIGVEASTWGSVKTMFR